MSTPEIETDAESEIGERPAREPDASRRNGNVLALLVVTQFIIVVDVSIVNVALPTLGRDLGFAQDRLSWVVNAYVLTFGGFLLLGGRLADRLGLRRVLISGLLVFSTASLAGGFATSEVQLIVARAVQGLGAALASSAALSVLLAMWKGTEREQPIAVRTIYATAAGTVGVLLGAILTDLAGWEWVFWATVPLGFGAAALAMRALPDSLDRRDPGAFDMLGALTVTAGLATLVYALADAQRAGWGSAQTVGLIALSGGLLAVFLLVESHATKPLLPLGAFRRPSMRAANLVSLLLAMAMFSMFYVVTLYLQQVLHFDALEAGLALLPLTATIMVLSLAVTKPVRARFGTKRVLTVGMLSFAAGLLWFSRVSVDGSFGADVLGPSLLAGIGLGLSFIPVAVAAFDEQQEGEEGLFAGLFNTSQQIGAGLGIAILAAIAGSVSGGVDPRGRLTSEQLVSLTDGFRTALLAGAGFALLGAAVALVLLPAAKPGPAPPDAGAPPEAGGTGAGDPPEDGDPPPAGEPDAAALAPR